MANDGSEEIHKDDEVRGYSCVSKYLDRWWILMFWRVCVDECGLWWMCVGR